MPSEATARALVLIASGRSTQEAATAEGISVRTLTRAMKRAGVTTNRRRSRRTAVEIQAALEEAKAQAQALALEQETWLPKVPTNAALQRLHGLQSELEKQGRKEAGDLRAVLAWIERKRPPGKLGLACNATAAFAPPWPLMQAGCSVAVTSAAASAGLSTLGTTAVTEPGTGRGLQCDAPAGRGPAACR